MSLQMQPPAGLPWATDPRQRAAAEAITSFVQAPLAGMPWSLQFGGVPTGVGTGTLFRAGSRVCVLTARHVAEDVLSRRHHSGIFWRGLPDALRDCFVQAYTAPDDVDVAVLLLKPEVAPGLVAATSLTSDAVAASDDGEIGAGQAVALAGYPWDLKRHPAGSDRATFTVLHLLPAVRPGCGAERHSPAGMHLGLSVDATTLPTGAARDMPEPAGVSGAAVWRVANRETAPGELWSPTRDAKIVGVQVSYFASLRCLRAEPVSSWGKWFHETLDEIAALGA